MDECRVCGDELTITQRKYCSGKCKSKAHYHNNKGNSYHSQSIRSLKRKVKLIEIKGGCCENCGYDKNISAFDFHHRDATKKESPLDTRILSNRTWDYILKEADKCDLLCANCHREFHYPNLEFTKVYDLLDGHKSFTSINLEKRENTRCLDCDIVINHVSKRCNICERNRRSKNKPDLEILKQERKTTSCAKLGKKYSVSRTSIRRWLGEI